ncbi:MAG: hypothetical protein ABSB59_22435 [Streptosporangiaceae bacterium]
MTLVHEFLTREERDGLPVSRPSPVIVFAGAGKTALLAELARLLAGNAPCARIDCEDFAGGARELLALLAFELNRHSGRYGELPFPRLITGLIVIRSVDLEDLDLKADRKTARERVWRVLEERQNTAQLLQDSVSEIIKAAFDALGSRMPAGPGVAKAAVDILTRVGPRLVLGSLAATRRGRNLILGTGQDWYGDQGRHKPVDGLISLNRMAAQGSEEDRREVASLLWAAFLADLDDAFGRRQAMNWTLNCLVLLDNADSQAGREFLAELVAARQERVADPLTVVATSRGELADQKVPLGGRLTPLVQASARPWRAADARPPAWYPVALPDLTSTDVGAMVRQLDLPGGTRRGSITSAVYRYTAGHPIAVRMLLDAIAVAPDPDSAGDADDAAEFDLAPVLEAPVPDIKQDDPPPLADVLLRRLLRGLPEEQLTDLVTCSAARDLEAAQRLAARSRLLGQNWGTKARIFSATFWRARGISPSAGALALHPVLRRLLLRRLAARPPAPVAPVAAAQHRPARSRPARRAAPGWTVVHAWLRADAAGDQVGVLYHALALGEIDYVAQWFAKALKTSEPEDWLRTLEAVATAPNSLPPGEQTLDQVDRLTEWTGPDDERTTLMARLVAALWIAADPLSDRHRPDLQEEIRDDLDRIALSSPKSITTIREHAKKTYADTPTAGTDAGTEPPPPSFTPPKSRRGIQRDRRIRVLAAVSAFAVAAGLAFGSYTVVSGGNGPAACAPAQGPFQVVTNGGECVGVTDGSYIFDPGDRGVAEAEQAIATENAAVVASKQGYVTVALLTVLTRPPTGSTTPSDVTLGRIEDELRGAYLALYHANHELGLHPEIRLLLANEGSTEQGWQTDWSQLRQIPASGSGELVAVAGMGLSVQATANAARTIGDAGIAMFGAVTTADGLDHAASPLLDRVVPSVSDEVTGLAGYLPKPAKAALVYDQDTADMYTSSLRADFKATFGPSLRAGVGEIPYVPSTLDSPLFKTIAQDLCGTDSPPLVLYAGRNSVFDQFVSQLEQEGDCNGEHLRIVTGGDADGLPVSATAGNRGGAQVSVVYADIEDPATLGAGFTHDFQTQIGRASSSMADPWLLADYDAVTVAANAIADGEGMHADDPAKVTASDVALWVGLLNKHAAVAGATGTLQIGADGDLENPAIPIMRLAAGKRTTLCVAQVGRRCMPPAARPAR